MFLLNIIPWYARLLAILALVAALWGHGAYTGYKHEHGQVVALQTQFDTFKAETAALGKAAEARVAKIKSDQKEISDAVIAEYARRLAALPRFGVQHQPTRPDGSPVPEIPIPSCQPHAAASDPVPAAIQAVAQSDFDALADLAAQTTLMLTALQQWVRDQQAAFP